MDINSTLSHNHHKSYTLIHSNRHMPPDCREFNLFLMTPANFCAIKGGGIRALFNISKDYWQVNQIKPTNGYQIEFLEPQLM